MDREEAKDFALKFSRKSRPDDQITINRWASDFGFQVGSFRTERLLGYMLNGVTYTIAFSVLVRDPIEFHVADLRSIIFTRLDAVEVNTRWYPHKKGEYRYIIYADAHIPCADEHV